MEWVVETGKPTLVAKVRYTDDAMTAQTMPSMRRPGELSKAATSTTFVRMVSATRPPTPTAPANSSTVAPHMACRYVREREETDEAHELATSLAPMFQASRKANTVPTAKR